MTFPGKSYVLNKMKTTPTPDKHGSIWHKSRGSYAINVGVYMVRAPHSLWESLYFRGFLRHTTPHFMAYFGSFFLLIWGVGVVKIIFNIPPSTDLPAGKNDLGMNFRGITMPGLKVSVRFFFFWGACFRNEVWVSVPGLIPQNSHFDLPVSVSCPFGPKDAEPSQLVQCQVLLCATPNLD